MTVDDMRSFQERYAAIVADADANEMPALPPALEARFALLELVAEMHVGMLEQLGQIVSP